MEYSNKEKERYIQKLKERRCPWCDSFLNDNTYSKIITCSGYFKANCTFHVTAEEYQKIRNS